MVYYSHLFENFPVCCDPFSQSFGIVNKAEMKLKKNKPIKLNIQKTRIMTSIPITSWQIDGEAMETVTDFIFWGFKLTADGD